MNYKKIPMVFLLSLISGLLVHTVAYAPIYHCSGSGCNQVFTQRRLLSIHERQHTGQRPFPCLVQECTQRFASNELLIRHMRRAHQQVLEDNREGRVRQEQRGRERTRRNQRRQERQQELQQRRDDEIQKEEK